MLLLTRKLNEQIQIGDNVTITIVSIEGGSKVRLGFEAPASVDIIRGEKAAERRTGRGRHSIGRHSA